MQRTTKRWGAPACAALALTLGLPAAAQAATAPPGVATGGAASVQQQTARLTGAVDPNGLETKYQFQYGTTSAYGAVTTEVTITGDGRRTVTADIAALAPATKYHYRLIARNAMGLTKGADRVFTTRRQPLGVTFSANPNPQPFGGTTTLAGTLTGTDNGGRDVVLESNPFPYTQGFKNVGNKLVTDAQGNFAFGLFQVPVNTQYRVALPDKPSVVSPIVVVGVGQREHARGHLPGQEGAQADVLGRDPPRDRRHADRHPEEERRPLGHGGRDRGAPQQLGVLGVQQESHDPPRRHLPRLRRRDQRQLRPEHGAGDQIRTR